MSLCRVKKAVSVFTARFLLARDLLDGVVHLCLDLIDLFEVFPLVPEAFESLPKIRDFPRVPVPSLNLSHIGHGWLRPRKVEALSNLHFSLIVSFKDAPTILSLHVVPLLSGGILGLIEVLRQLYLEF